MKTKRKFRREIISTKRTLAVQRISKKIESRVCEKCEDFPPMLEPDFIRTTFNVSEREIFRLVENDLIHFLETDHKKIFVCLTTLEKALGGEIKLISEKKN